MSGPSGSCPLAQFETYVNNRSAELGDFIQLCGLSNVTGDPDIVDFYTNPQSRGANTSMVLLGIDPQVGQPNPFGS